MSRRLSKLTHKTITSFVLLAFLVSGNMAPLPLASAQEALTLPSPTARMELSPVFLPPLLKGIKVYPNDPFRFDFILDKGEADDSTQEVKTDSARLIRYFLAALTVPEKDIWVNLSPFEQDRIVPEAFGQTEMGRDLLAQDYILKQITASVIYPENTVGQEFWAKVYAEALKRYGTTDVPVDTFNKVWILPEKATVYENKNTAYVVESRLKVMLEEDYVALNNTIVTKDADTASTNKLGSEIVREVVIPILEKEVNEGKNFAPLRQVYNSLILATWYKRKIKASLLGQAYVAQKKTAGIDIYDKEEKERIWEQYVEAFKTGAYNLIKEEYDPGTQTVIPRKYFSGGFIADAAMMDNVLSYTNDLPQEGTIKKGQALVINTRLSLLDAAMLNQNKSNRPWDIETIRPEISRLLSTSSRPKLLRYQQLSSEQLQPISDWLFSQNLLPEAPLLKQLIYNIYIQSTTGDKKVAEGWLSLMAQKWNLDNEILNRLIAWFRQNKTFATEVAEGNLYAFMRAYVTAYQQLPDLRRSFIYNFPDNLSGDTQLTHATANITRMTAISQPDFVANRTILKAPIEGTPYFIGFQYGLAESTHGLYLALGKERQGHDPLNGTFFRIGLDSMEGGLRIIMMQGLAGAEKEINEAFPNTVGLHPGVALLYVAAALAEQGHLRYDNITGLDTSHKESFEKLVGIRPEFIPTMKNGTPSIGLVERSVFKNASPRGNEIFNQLTKDGLMKGSNEHGYIRANIKVMTEWLRKNFPEETNVILSILHPDPMQLMISYARFGLRKTSYFERWQETAHLTQVLIPERVKRGDDKSKAIMAMTEAFRNLKPIQIKFLETEDELLRNELTDENPPAPSEEKLDRAQDRAQKPVTSKQTIEGRNVDVTKLITSPVFARKTGLNIKEGELKIVDIGIGYPAITAIEAKRELGALNPAIKFIGTELPQATPRAQIVIGQGQLLDSLNKIITSYMQHDKDFLNGRVTEVSFVMTDSGDYRYGNISEIVATFETPMTPGVKYFMPVAYAPNVNLLNQAAGVSLGSPTRNAPLFMELLDTLGINRIEHMMQTLGEQKKDLMSFSHKPDVDQTFFVPEQEGAGEIAVRKNPVRQALEQEGIEFVETEHLLQANITDVNIIMANHVITHLQEGPRNRFFRIAERALRDNGVLVIKNADMQDEKDITSFVSKIDVYQKTNGVLTYLGSTLSDVFTKEFFGNDRFESYGKAKGLMNAYAFTENPTATTLKPLLSPTDDLAMNGEKPVNLFSGDLNGRVIFEQAGQYRLAKVVKTSELKAGDRRNFAKALLDMSRKPGVASAGKVLSVSHLAMGVAQNAIQGEIYAAVDEKTSAILALQVVEKPSSGNATMRLWISADTSINFLANQLLAYSVNDLLALGIQSIDASWVSYTPRVREAGLLSGVNNVQQLQTFLANNARGVVNALGAATGNPSAQEILSKIDRAQQAPNYLKDVRVDFRGNVNNFYRATIEIGFEDTPIVMNTLKKILPGENVEQIGIARVQVSKEYFTDWGDNKKVYKVTSTLKDGREVAFIVKLPNIEEEAGLKSLWAEWQWRRRVNELAPSNNFFPEEGDIQEITVVNRTRNITHKVFIYTEAYLNGPDFERIAERPNALTPEERRQAAHTFIEWYVNLWLLTDGYQMPSERYKRNVMFEATPEGRIDYSRMKSFDTGIFYQEMTFTELVDFIREEFTGAWQAVGEEELQNVLKARGIDTEEGLKRASSQYPRLRLNTYDENGRLTGETATYKEIHEQKKFHEVVWIVVLDNNGKLVLQHRPFGKQDHPGLWDVYGGHIEAGQSTMEAATKLIQNEAGIFSPVKFVPLTTERAIKRSVTYQGFTENVFVTVLAAQLTPEQVRALRPTPEALAFDAVPIQDLPKQIQQFRPTDNLQYLLSEGNLLRQAEALVDKAQVKNPGGIDLNPDKIDLTTLNNGEAITFNIDPAQLARIQNAAGLTPVIINVVPLGSLSQFLGTAK